MDGAVRITEVVDRSRLSGFQRRVLAICCLLTFADGLNALSIGYAIPALAQDFRTGPEAFAIVVVAALVGELVAEFVLVPLADVVGRRRVMRFGILLFGVATVLCFLAGSVTELAVLRFLAGIGVGASVPTCAALAAEFTPSRLKATIQTVVSVGAAGGGMVIGFIAAAVVPRFGGATLLLIAGALPLLLLLATWFLLPESIEFLARKRRYPTVALLLGRVDPTRSYPTEGPYPVEGPTGPGGLRRIGVLFRDGFAGRTLTVWFMLFFALFTSYFIFSWLPSLLGRAGVGEAGAALATSVASLGGILGGITLGVLMDRLRPRAAMIAAGPVVQIVAAILLVLALGAGAPDGLVVLIAFFYGFGSLGTASAVTALAALAYPTPIRAIGLGWATGFSRIGGLFAPALGGALIAAGLPTPTILAISLAAPVVVGALAVVYRVAEVRRSRSVRLAPTSVLS